MHIIYNSNAEYAASAAVVFNVTPQNGNCMIPLFSFPFNGSDIQMTVLARHVKFGAELAHTRFPSIQNDINCTFVCLSLFVFRNEIEDKMM
jgi:hypothetical protein